jgi:bifunctional DNA-binding transcriptional regulator/antitoxin component of YhaV-PrlF toxin-antitoxin module
MAVVLPKTLRTSLRVHEKDTVYITEQDGGFFVKIIPRVSAAQQPEEDLARWTDSFIARYRGALDELKNR